jgi:hypothetical protein
LINSFIADGISRIFICADSGQIERKRKNKENKNEDKYLIQLVKQLMYEKEAKDHMDNHDIVEMNLHNIDIEHDYLVNNYLVYLYQLILEIVFHLYQLLVCLFLIISL